MEAQSFLSSIIFLNQNRILGFFEALEEPNAEEGHHHVEILENKHNRKKIHVDRWMGAYRDDEGKPVVLQCVRDAEAKISGSEFLESFSTAISSKLVEESVKLIYGKDVDVIKEGRFAGVQALSGTGACRLFAEFQRRFYPKSNIFLPVPTWSNVICADSKQAIAIKSQLQQIARAMYSSPPVHGVLLVSTILGNPVLKALWVKEVKGNLVAPQQLDLVTHHLINFIYLNMNDITLRYLLPMHVMGGCAPLTILL
ncbi:hypothetical protein L1049_009301 [Liquidambar formosana]|uniref:Aminotransferase class I/classII large domain-containing protein n=1 Tax=Liquidambar formosana TaxID=63359 RepID=A0AAP0X2T9_LIQFO